MQVIGCAGLPLKAEGRKRDMFSIRFTQMSEEFVATVKWDDPGLGGTLTEVYKLTAIRTTLNFDKLLDFDLENSRAVQVDSRAVDAEVLFMVGRELETHWSSYGEHQRRALVSFLANIFVCGTSVVSETALPWYERHTPSDQTDPPRGGGYSKH